MLFDHLRARWLREFLTHDPSLTPDPIRKLSEGEGSEGERQHGEGSKRELVPQRDRNSVLKENGTIPLAQCWFSGAITRRWWVPHKTMRNTT